MTSSLFRATNGPTTFPNLAWTFLSSQANIDLGSILDQLVSRPLIEKVGPSSELTLRQTLLLEEDLPSNPWG